MKKRTILVIAMLIGMISFAQQREGFNYKALITNNGNPVANQNVDLKFSIRMFSNMPSINVLLWQEEHANVATDANGICSVVIGRGNRLAGSETNFRDIDWLTVVSNLQLKVEVDTGSGYHTLVNNETMQAVPFAKQAVKASKLDKQYDKIVFSNNSHGVVFDTDNTGAHHYSARIDGIGGFSIFSDNTPMIQVLGNQSVLIHKDLTVQEDALFNGEIHASASGDADMKAYVYGYFYDTDVVGYRSSDGFTASKISTGVYRISFTDTTVHNSYIVLVTADNMSHFRVAVCDYRDNYFDVKMYDQSGSLVDNSFHFVVFRK